MKNENCLCTNCTCEKPVANLTINKGRIKLYDKSSDKPIYYLKDGQEFEIELFNPKTSDIMIKISMDGKLISQNGIVLKPGQRFFLDRHIDVAKKFKFETYEVGKSEAVKKAIQNNGEIEFNFYDEKLPSLNSTLNPPQWVNHDWGKNTYYSSNITNIGGTMNLDSTGDNPYDVKFTTTSFINQNDSPDFSWLRSSSPINEKSDDNVKGILRSSSRKMETGKVETGSDSTQRFERSSKTFQTIPSHTIKYKILPVSNKTIETNDLKRYCTNCGAVMKKTNKFCAQCGTKG